MTRNCSFENQYSNILLEQYKTSCELCGTFPDYETSERIKHGKVIFNIDKLDLNTIEPLCHTISQIISPINIEIKRSSVSGIKTAPISKLFHRIIKAVSNSLMVSKTFCYLKLMNIKVPSVSLSLLHKGLMKTKQLQHLNFENCCLKDEGIQKICLALKNATSVNCVTFDNCSFGYLGAKAISNMIMHQSQNRSSLSWQDTLRGNIVELDAMKGLKKIYLNNNPILGDEGAQALISALMDDIWITDLTLKNCGLTEAIVGDLQKLIKANERLEAVDICNNPFLGEEYALEIKHELCKRNPYVFNKNKSSQETHLKDIEGSETLLEIPSKVFPQQIGIPYRIEGRILERKENLPAGSLRKVIKELDKLKPFKKKTAIGITFNLNNIRKIVTYYKKKVSFEKKQRLKAEVKRNRTEGRLMRLEQKLKRSYVLDEEDLAHIEHTFFNFENLLRKLEKAG